MRFSSLLLLVSAFWPVACISDGAPEDHSRRATPFVEPEGGYGGLPPDSTLPAIYRREGLVSSNTYQVCVSVLAASSEEARALGEDLGKQRATELMQHERAISSRIGYYGRQAIQKLVESDGRVVRVHHEHDQNYTVVLQVYRAGLYKYLQQLH